MALGLERGGVAVCTEIFYDGPSIQRAVLGTLCVLGAYLNKV